MPFPEKIVLASGNPGKVKEFANLFAEQQVSVVPQKELGVKDVPETGTTFVENAIIKARHAAKQTGLPAIADDSGLVVNALGGPRVFIRPALPENRPVTATILSCCCPVWVMKPIAAPTLCAL